MDAVGFSQQRTSLEESEALKKDVKLNVKDRMLIQLLIQDSRTSISELSKKLGVSKPAIT